MPFYCVCVRSGMIGNFSSNVLALAVVILMLGTFYILSRSLSKMSYHYVAGSHSIAYVTVPNEELAKKIARGLVEKKLAACVNIIPGIKSIYQWQGSVEEDSELLLMIKTKTSRISDISKFVRENHSYDVAEVISTKIEDGNPPYLEWLSNSVDDV